MSTQDNIARVEDVTDRPEQPTQQPTQQVQDVAVKEFFNLGEVVRSINSQYEREFPKLTFNTPQQITDGCVAEFIDASMGVTVATARVRIRNRLIINNENGEMFLQVQLSDLSFSRPSVPVGLKK